MKILISPHNDDESLFAAFTILREKPTVVIVFDSEVQVRAGYEDCDIYRRRSETVRAMDILGAEEVIFLGISDADPDALPKARAALSSFVDDPAAEPAAVYAPAIEEGGHVQHNMVGMLADELFHHVTHYMTYTNRGKSHGVPVPFEPDWPILKLKALACYESQIRLLSTRDHFLREQCEYQQSS